MSIYEDGRVGSAILNQTMVTRSLSLVGRGGLAALTSKLTLGGCFRLFCTAKPSMNHHALLTRLLQVPKSMTKTTLDSDHGFAPDSHGDSWDALVTALRRSFPDKAKRVLEWRLEKMQETNVTDQDQYSELISLCGKIRNIPLAMKVFMSMEAHGIQPNTSVFNSLIHTCLCPGNITTAYSLFEVMESSVSYRPDAGTYDTFISGLFELRNSDAMRRCFKAKKDSGFCINLQNYECLIGDCVRSRDFDGADRFYEEMMQAGIAPSVAILENILEGLCKLRDSSRIKEFVSSVLREGYKISENMAEKLVKVFGESKQVEDLEELLQTFLGMKQDHEVLLSLHCGIIQIHAMLDRLDDVEYSVGRMFKQGFSFKHANDVEKVVSAYFRCDAYDRLDLFLEHTKGKYQLTRSTREFLVAGYRRAGLQEKADSLIKDIESAEML